MGCVIVLCAILEPRCTLLLLWALTDTVTNTIGGGWLVVCVLVAPYTGLGCVAVGLYGDSHGVLIALGVILDIMRWLHLFAKPAE